MEHRRARDGIIELHWDTELHGGTRYVMYARENNGQLVLLSTFTQGPFDTALEVSHWVWRVITREVPPASA